MCRTKKIWHNNNNTSTETLTLSDSSSVSSAASLRRRLKNTAFSYYEKSSIDDVELLNCFALYKLSEN